MTVQIDKVITKILDYDTMSKIAYITGIDLECQTDIWIGYDDLVNNYSKLISQGYVTSKELNALIEEQADYVAFRLEV